MFRRPRGYGIALSSPCYWVAASAEATRVLTPTALSLRQAQALLNSPDVSTTKGLRDRAVLAVLLGCGLRRSDTSLNAHCSVTATGASAPELAGCFDDQGATGSRCPRRAIGLRPPPKRHES